MKKYVFYISLFIIVGLVIFLVQDSDEFSWLRAKFGNKSTDYAQYIKSNPNGWHVLEAQRRFDDRSWKEAQKVGTLAHFRNYIRQNPEGLYVDAANESIQMLLWIQVAQKDTIADYEQFTEQYPDSKYVVQAKSNIEKLQWQKVSTERDIGELKKFIEKYLDGQYLSQAQRLLEDVIWEQASKSSNKEKIREYISLYPSGIYFENAKKMLSDHPDSWHVFMDSYHLYDLTSIDKDYGYVFENQIRDILSKFKTVEVVSEKSDAVVHLQIGYALSFRDGQSGEDNISKFIENRWRDRAIVKQQRALPTYDIALQLYLWDIANDCLLAYSASVIPPEPGNAAAARAIGRDKFLADQVKIQIENSFVPFLGSLQKGKDDVMCLVGDNPTSFYRQNIGKPKRKVCVDFENGSITVYQWRDPSIERYIYFNLQQSDMDCVRTFDNQCYRLKVTWAKYDRLIQAGSLLREFGLQADFEILEKSKEGKDRIVFNKTISSDINMEKYGVLPVEVINQWRKVFDNSYIIATMLKIMKNPPLNSVTE